MIANWQHKKELLHPVICHLLQLSTRVPNVLHSLRQIFVSIVTHLVTEWQQWRMSQHQNQKFHFELITINITFKMSILLQAWTSIKKQMMYHNTIGN